MKLRSLTTTARHREPQVVVFTPGFTALVAVTAAVPMIILGIATLTVWR